MAAEAAKKDGQVKWGSIHRLQKAHSGHRPVKTAAVLKTDGELTKGPEEVIDRWYEHFKNLLSIYDERLLLLCLPCHHRFNMTSLLLWRSWRLPCLQEGRWSVWDCAGVDFVWRFCFARQAACITEGCLE